MDSSVPQSTASEIRARVLARTFPNARNHAPIKYDSHWHGECFGYGAPQLLDALPIYLPKKGVRCKAYVLQTAVSISLDRCPATIGNWRMSVSVTRERIQARKFLPNDFG